jgi:hypothetical protein
MLFLQKRDSGDRHIHGLSTALLQHDMCIDMQSLSVAASMTGYPGSTNGAVQPLQFVNALLMPFSLGKACGSRMC